MKKTGWHGALALTALLGSSSITAQAGELDLAADRSLMLASTDAGMSAPAVSVDATDAPTETTTFEAPLFSDNKVHQYLGIGALSFLALAIVSPKEEDGPHEYFATGAAALGAATVTSGLITHWDDFDFDDGLSDPDNLHMLLGTTGALLMVAAVAQAPEGGHAGLGIAGGVAMGVAVKMTW